MWDITVFLECGQFLRNKRSLNGAIERGDKLKLHALKFTSRYATSTTYLGRIMWEEEESQMVENGRMQ